MILQNFFNNIDFWIFWKKKLTGLDEFKSIQLLRKTFSPEVSAAVYSQIKNSEKYRNKFPKLIENQGIISNIVAAQATDEVVANHKASFFKGLNFLDLTAGMAIDAFAFAQIFQNVIATDISEERIEIAKMNAQLLNLKNIHFLAIDAQSFLAQTDIFFDLIYVDPSRIDELQKKKYHPKDCEPNVFKMLQFLKLRTNQVLIKLSPMVDIHELFQWFDSIEWIWIISKNDECKEVLVQLNFQVQNPPKIRLSIYHDATWHVLEREYSLGKKFQYNFDENIDFQDFKWVIVPDSGIYKSGLTNLLAVENQAWCNHLYGIWLAKQIPIKYFGRVRKILKIMPLAELPLFLKNREKKFQVIKKNFPLTVEEIRKKFSLQDSNSECLIFTTFFRKEKLVIYCEI